jgi:uncharacterized protein YchJ
MELEWSSSNEHNFVLSESCGLVLDHQLHELKDEALYLIENKLYRFCSPQEFTEGLALDPQVARAEYLGRTHNQKILDIEKSVDWWFQLAIEHDEDDMDEDEFSGFDLPHTISPMVRVEPKVGRNDACPCGSGKKYKKCCGGAE